MFNATLYQYEKKSWKLNSQHTLKTNYSIAEEKRNEETVVAPATEPTISATPPPVTFNGPVSAFSREASKPKK
jgi:hypothetical protein